MVLLELHSSLWKDDKALAVGGVCPVEEKPHNDDLLKAEISFPSQNDDAWLKSACRKTAAILLPCKIVHVIFIARPLGTRFSASALWFWMNRTRDCTLHLRSLRIWREHGVRSSGVHLHGQGCVEWVWGCSGQWRDYKAGNNHGAGQGFGPGHFCSVDILLLICLLNQREVVMDGWMHC